MNELNLLLRHQIIKGSDDLPLNYSRNVPQETFYQEEYSSSFVLPRKAAFHDLLFEEQCEGLKIELATVQLEESSALEQHRMLIESYNMLEALGDDLLNHIDCVSLEVKSSSRLSLTLNSFAVREQCMDEQISSNLKQLHSSYELSTLERFKRQLLMILNDNNCNVKKLYGEFQERQSNYKLALKNFKIILEILNVNDDSLKKLKQQFDEVLMDYQHCRCILDHELPFAIAERTKVLADCLISLGAEYDMLADRRKTLASLCRDIGRKVQDNEFILVKKELNSPRSSDND
ncbi:uncharacterized protein LOC109545543 [Dendroctonus ponderosae]|uniref:Uncharacterized protein n=2 Tax=Dendroctonus ponderosae TaxID=77166 RepID=A0AAR5QGD1_DENPD|nr:uncharacterized protein LOC109545543 [Dendroctonus ponderosae]KAH1001042.1 hypothetical protein HUJ04_013304 [Dendroctonus ponderosae]KAH1006367.1 hypothetical protein HUJ05_007108 [Dendroctonus ponderosae]